MNENKHLPLTETVYYVLLSLLHPAHGYIIMKNIEDLSGGRVKMAPGTLYGAIENLLKHQLIEPYPSLHILPQHISSEFSDDICFSAAIFTWIRLYQLMLQ